MFLFNQNHMEDQTMRSFEGWAPPARVWGPWVELAKLTGGPLTYRVDFDTISSAPSTFDAEIQYWKGPSQTVDLVTGPGSHTFTAGICYCIQRIRFRSHSLGQTIQVKVTP
ncbi:colicin Z C-terminal domain-related protein [Desulfomicrobium salsuginis]